MKRSEEKTKEHGRGREMSIHNAFRFLKIVVGSEVRKNVRIDVLVASS